jgi:hypothetical protein
MSFPSDPFEISVSMYRCPAGQVPSEVVDPALVLGGQLLEAGSPSSVSRHMHRYAGRPPRRVRSHQAVATSRSTMPVTLPLETSSMAESSLIRQPARAHGTSAAMTSKRGRVVSCSTRRKLAQFGLAGAGHAEQPQPDAQAALRQRIRWRAARFMLRLR